MCVCVCLYIHLLYRCTHNGIISTHIICIYIFYIPFASIGDLYFNFILVSFLRARDALQCAWERIFRRLHNIIILLQTPRAISRRAPRSRVRDTRTPQSAASTRRAFSVVAVVVVVVVAYSCAPYSLCAGARNAIIPVRRPFPSAAVTSHARYTQCYSDVCERHAIFGWTARRGKRVEKRLFPPDLSLSMRDFRHARIDCTCAAQPPAYIIILYKYVVIIVIL